MYQRILVASDASEGALDAVEAAAELAAKYKADLVALHAYEVPPFLAAMTGGAGINGLECIDPSINDEWLKGTNETIRQRTTAILKAGDARFRYVEQLGHPARTIVRVAEEEQCDLIVVGSRGLSGISSLLMGSVSERVAHLAHCSVLIVR